MNVYIDKKNLVSYVHSKGDARFEDCNTMLKKCCDIKFTFPKDDIKALEKTDADYILMWLTKMSQGIKGDVEWGVNFPPRPLKSNMCNDFSLPDLSAIYLLDDEKCKMVKQTGCLLVEELGNEIDALSQLIIGDDNPYTRVINPRKLDNWSNIEQLFSPCTDIIIADPYLMSDQDLYENNLYELVTKLALKAKCKLNYIFLSEKEYRINGVTISPDWDLIKTNIKRKVERITGYKPNVTFILKQRIEHDRTIFTNYKQYVSGDTFNYFNSRWEVITRGRYLNVYSIASRDCWEGCCSFISDMQAVIMELERINPDQIIGDKKSCYLKFS